MLKNYNDFQHFNIYLVTLSNPSFIQHFLTCMNCGCQTIASSDRIFWKEGPSYYGVRPPWGPPIENNAK